MALLSDINADINFNKEISQMKIIESIHEDVGALAIQNGYLLKILPRKVKEMLTETIKDKLKRIPKLGITLNAVNIKEMSHSELIDNCILMLNPQMKISNKLGNGDSFGDYTYQFATRR